MSGSIEKIKLYREKGAAGTELREGRLIENLGLEGDFYARGGERQLSLLAAESLEQAAGAKERGLCFLRFKENISIRGLTPGLLRPGARFGAGESVLEITGETKHCHEECALYQAGKRCSLAGLSLFAKVVKGGVIRTGDEFVLSDCM